MNDIYLDRRKHFRTPCDWPMRCRTEESRFTFRVCLLDINDTGLAFAFVARRALEVGQIIEMTMPQLDVREPLQFRVRWIKEGAAGGAPSRQAGAEVVASSAKAYAELVEKIRHIQCWRQMEEHVQKRSISMEEALRRWKQEHSERK